MDDEYTPTVEQFFAWLGEIGTSGDVQATRRMIAQVERVAAAKALREAAALIESHWAPDTAEGEEIVEVSVGVLRDRADRIESEGTA